MTGRCPLNSRLNQERKPPLPLKGGQKGTLFLPGKGGPTCSRAASSLPYLGQKPAGNRHFFLILFILIFSRQNSRSTLQTVLKICCVHNSKEFHGLFAKNKNIVQTYFFFFPFFDPSLQISAGSLLFKPLLEADSAVWIWPGVGTASLAPAQQVSPLRRGRQGSWRQARHTLKGS